MWVGLLRGVLLCLCDNLVDDVCCCWNLVLIPMFVKRNTYIGSRGVCECSWLVSLVGRVVEQVRHGQLDNCEGAKGHLSSCALSTIFVSICFSKEATIMKC